MKSARIAALIAAASHVVFPLVSVFAQGALTPPGAPAPTMKSLDQVEARTAITNAASLVTISQPGSYYLTRNLTVASGNGIDITTNGVTLDLNGFTIRSTAAAATGTGILLSSGLRNITIANGFIQGGVTNNGSGGYNGGGFAYGIAPSGIQPANILVSRISVSGCSVYGIYVGTGDSTVVESCTVRTLGSYGILASIIKSCVAMDCGSHAIYGDQVSDSHGDSTSGSYGIYAITYAQNCYGSSIDGDGVGAGVAQNCYGYSGSGTGIYTYGAENCFGDGGTGIGINTATAQNCYGINNGSTYAIVTATAQNCYGKNNGSGYGLYAIDTASGCYGFSTSGTGLSAFIANVCRGQTTSGTALSTSHNVNSL